MKNSLNQTLDEARRIALESVKGQDFYEKNTKLFFDGFSNLLSSLSAKQTVEVQTLKDLLTLDNEAIFMLMKISEDEELKALTLGHDLESFNMQHAPSFTAINAVLNP